MILTLMVAIFMIRISEEGDITYSMRLTIKAKCPMMLSNFPMDWQSCPLIFGSCEFSTVIITMLIMLIYADDNDDYDDDDDDDDVDHDDDDDDGKEPFLSAESSS